MGAEAGTTREGTAQEGPARGGAAPEGTAQEGPARGGAAPEGAGQAGSAGTPGRRHHGNRHGRSEIARLAVLEAADNLLAEKGFSGVTMEGMAARAGVAKQTIYRWWSTKTDVLMDAFLQDVAEEPLPVDHGDIALDLHDHLDRLGRFLGDSDPGAVFRALTAQAQHDPAFAKEFRSRYLDEQRRRDRAPLERAVGRGELPADLDVAAETDQIVGPLYYRVLVTGEPVGPDFTNRLVESFLRRLG
ncbi:TetR/AcrR family transcriptional regulator [Streptomyces sp. NPDC059398]|uniref:TetR/AcrR family transcriptional regulator n=1 Tax=Streptomyces sp. NPDC059398 TaxID=3346820 RepID=UPI00368739A5